MRITADTNVLVLALTSDHPEQSRLAQAALSDAEVIALPLAGLCELVWVLARGYGVASADIADALVRVMASANVAVNRPAAEAGLAMLSAGGDFADGVIAFEGEWLGAECFASFDRKAVRLIEAQGRSARLLG